MNTYIIIAQTVGIIAMCMIVLSQQCRSNRNYFICQEIGGSLFMLSYTMLGAWGGTLMNLYGAIRCETLRHSKIAKSKWTLICLLVLLTVFNAVVLLLTTEKWYYLFFAAFAQYCGTFSMWSQNGKWIRWCQLLAVSPFWVIYNSIIPIPSIGGILTETFCIISVLIALFRYRKIGFTER